MTIRQLRPGEQIPLGAPKRYKSSHGYIRLRWPTGAGGYVETYEHRIVAGVVTDDHVHHINGDKEDNRPENLEILSSTEHAAHHASFKHAPDDEIAHLYESGLSMPEISERTGWNNGTLSRSLRRSGVTVIQGERNSTKIDEDAVLALYYQGIRVARIASLLGIGRGPITKMLQRHGLPMFPPGAPRNLPDERTLAGFGPDEWI